jgi:hypothetical protein
MKWLATHKAASVLLALLLLWLYRLIWGKTSAGHASPEDAISYGWSVYPAGIGGWLEVSPDGQTQYLHESGWTGDPFARL